MAIFSKGKPVITVITVCLNASEYIERAIISVLGQSYPLLEYVIIDGGSTDGTVDIINSYLDRIDYFTSGPDKGIYNAMNKGIKASKGDIIFFLNADDCFYDNLVLENAMREFISDTDLMILYGDVLVNYGNTTKVKSHSLADRKFLYFDTICHQAVFSRRELFERFGYFDEIYEICADYDWLLNTIVKHRIRRSYTPFIVSIYHRYGVSSIHGERFMQEKDLIQKKYFNYVERMMYKFFPGGIKSLLNRLVLRQ